MLRTGLLVRVYHKGMGNRADSSTPTLRKGIQRIKDDY